MSEPEIVTTRHLNGLFVIPFDEQHPMLRIYEWEIRPRALPRDLKISRLR